MIRGRLAAECDGGVSNGRRTCSADAAKAGTGSGHRDKRRQAQQAATASRCAAGQVTHSAAARPAAHGPVVADDETPIPELPEGHEPDEGSRSARLRPGTIMVHLTCWGTELVGMQGLRRSCLVYQEAGGLYQGARAI